MTLKERNFEQLIAIHQMVSQNASLKESSRVVAKDTAEALIELRELRRANIRIPIQGTVS